MNPPLLVCLHFPVLYMAKHYYANYTEYDGVRFTTDPVEECDYLIVVNHAGKDLEVSCPPENVWLFFQEHGHRAMHPWMHGQHEDYAKVFTPHADPADLRQVKFHTPMAWLHKRTPEFLEALTADDLPKEPGLMAMWGSNAILSGHKRRQAFWDEFVERSDDSLPLYLFGRGTWPVDDKWDVYKHFSYALAIENARVTGYWTEKIMDAFLSFTLPFYFGSDDIADYFPEESFIRIDLDDFEASRETILRSIHDGEREKRLSAIAEARHRVIHRHSFIPCVARLIRESYRQEERRKVRVRRWTRS